MRREEIVRTKTGNVFLEDTKESYSGDDGSLSEKNGMDNRKLGTSNAYLKLAQLLMEDLKTSRQEADK